MSAPGTGVRRPARALIALGAVVVVLGVVVAGLWWLDHRNSQVDAARQAALHAAQEQVVTVLSTEQATAPAARQRVITRVEVIASAVVRAEPDEVVLLLFVNQATQSSQFEAVQLSGHRIQLTMTRVDDRWLISTLERV